MADLDLTQDPTQDPPDGKDPIKQSDPTGNDIFKLAKNILLFSFFLYVGVFFLFAFSVHLCIKDQMKEIWEFSSQGLFGIINLIIGFYFGGKINKRN